MPKIVASKNDWISIGYQDFTDYGEKGIVIDKMAKKLQCNRSSFYWHFKTKQSFISEIIDSWIELETNNVIKAIDKLQKPQERFDTLVRLSFKQNPNLDFVFYLKKYSIRDKKSREAIYKIDGLRKQCLTEILIELGFSERESKVKSMIFYKYLIGYHETIRYTKQKKDYLIDIVEDLKYFI